MKQWLLEVFHMFLGAGIYYLARYYVELETMPLDVMTLFGIAGMTLWMYGVCEVIESVYKTIKEWKNGQSRE